MTFVMFAIKDKNIINSFVQIYSFHQILLLKKTLFLMSQVLGSTILS